VRPAGCHPPPGPAPEKRARAECSFLVANSARCQVVITHSTARNPAKFARVGGIANEVWPGRRRPAPAAAYARPRTIADVALTLSGAGGYIVAPRTQGANSSSPKPICSLLVFCPEAVLRMRSKIRSPQACTVSLPSTMVPQLTSMSSVMR